MWTIYLVTEPRYPATRNSIHFAAVDVHSTARRAASLIKDRKGNWRMRVRESSTVMHARAEKYRQQCEERLNEMRACILRATPMAICAWFAWVSAGETFRFASLALPKSKMTTRVPGAIAESTLANIALLVSPFVALTVTVAS